MSPPRPLVERRTERHKRPTKPFCDTGDPFPRANPALRGDSTRSAALFQSVRGRSGIARLCSHALKILPSSHARNNSHTGATRSDSRRVTQDRLDSSLGSSDIGRLLFNYTGVLNQGFAKVFALASSTAILFWSVAMARSGVLSAGLGVYGCIFGPLVMLGVLSGHLRLNVHGMAMLILAVAGALLWHAKSGAPR